MFMIKDHSLEGSSLACLLCNVIFLPMKFLRGEFPLYCTLPIINAAQIQVVGTSSIVICQADKISHM